MSLNKVKLKKDLKDLFKSLKESEDPDKSIDDFAEGLSSIIDAYIKTATVTVKPGIAVTTPGGAGSTSAPGSGSIS